MADQLLERFHRALIEEIQTQRPEYLTQPFTVAEIYQNLVPYGSHRDRIGVEMNGDYEDALVRLLAGEGGYLILDSEPALKNLRAALDAPNPNSGVYREFAAVDVRLNQAYLDLSAEALDELPDLVEELEAEDPVTMTHLAPSEGNATARDLGVVPPGVDIFADGGSSAGDTPAGDGGANGDGGVVPVVVEAGASETDSGRTDTDASRASNPAASDESDLEPSGMQDSEAAEESGTRPPSVRPPLEPEYVEAPEADDEASAVGGAGGSCVWCRADLPDRDNLRYCPFCGTDVRLVPCVSCGAEIEPEWRFCVACGTEVDG